MCIKFASADVKKYHQFWTMHGLEQQIQWQVFCSTSNLIDYIFSLQEFFQMEPLT